ncbi:hypothetical protein LshimejAT787_0408290 [Lyophyllum shimeji]|uniref:Uncharacterized protein n=1 Tax=Lyophyllum shimeji TaxID=47721 RepID=A0A9P3ULM2_LYOSH|nr:hypothetical protein LshimejAT787_0408290 [Lyophyllum shimeji]
MATYRSEPPVPTDIITYRLGSKLVYVRPADNYEQALELAQKEFSEDLAGLSRDRISFNITAKMNGERRHVRISESAWVAAVTRLLRGEVIDIHVRPPPGFVDTKEPPPPQYLEVPQTTLRHSSTPSSPRSRSRDPSPSPSERGSSRSWFGKH